MVRLLIATAIAVHMLVAPLATAEDTFTLELETGAAWQLRNDFAVPGDTGTLVRLDDEGPSFSGRATLNWNLNERWSMRFLAAPLSTDGDYVPEGDVLFQNTIFAAGSPSRSTIASTPTGSAASIGSDLPVRGRSVPG